VAPQIIDVDQHLFETRTTWIDHIDPGFRADALAIEDDERGWPWVTWRGERLYPVEIQHPGHPEEVGENRLAMERGEPAPASYEELLPPSYASPAARVEDLDRMGLDSTVLFPNFGLVWGEMLRSDPPAQTANLRAYNRWAAAAVTEGKGRLHGVGHLTLSDPEWAVAEIGRLASDGIRLAMVPPAPVNGRPLSQPDLDPVWAAFCDHGVAAVFHVSEFESPLHPAWYEGDEEKVDKLLDSVFLWAAPAVALANMILNGTLDRFPALRIGVVELTAGWVPTFLLHIDGASDFYALRHGGPYKKLALRPSEYFLRQVRVAALPYEQPGTLVEQVGEDMFMFGSDWPHAEGVADPLAAGTRGAGRLEGRALDQLMGGNAAWLLGL
jgi:predicted TIM-barrel fold metal-dependent hydrolase